MTINRTLRGLAVLALLAAAAGCGGTGSEPAGAKAAAKPDIGKPGLHEKVPLDGDKTYDVYVPENRKPKEEVPAVLVLHGMPGDAAEARDQSQLDVLAEKEGFLAVYPDNPDGSWDPEPKDRADIDFIGDVVTELTDTWNADPDRIFVSGISNGGDMALTVGARLSDRVAAVAPVVLAGTGKVADVVEAVAEPVPVIAFFGGNDPRWSVGAGLVETWRERADCGKAKTDKAEAVTVKAYKCAGDVAVEVQEVAEGFHEWFGTPAEPEPVWASAAMWEFFTEHPRP